MRSLFLPISAFLVGTVVAQDLGVPTSWREFGTSLSLADRISIAQSGINTILPQLTTATGSFNGIGYWQDANVFSAMANQDHFAQTTTNQATVTTCLNNVFALYANYDQYHEDNNYNDDAMWWATAAVYAYRAYEDSNLLAHAVATWTHVSQYVISTAQAASSSFPNKINPILGTCNGVTMAGGVFWRPTDDDMSINSITTGLYINLSAMLAEITGDSTYTNAAILSATWIQQQNINADDIVLDSISAQDCTRSPDTWLFTYNSGKYIEGLSVLADVTGDASWTTLLVDITVAALKSAPWQGTNGVITEGADNSVNNDDIGFKSVLVRGLTEAFLRNEDYYDFQVLIHSYVDVQYNAVMELAGNGNMYSADWLGPPPTAFTTWGQLAALDALTSAIAANT